VCAARVRGVDQQPRDPVVDRVGCAPDAAAHRRLAEHRRLEQGNPEAFPGPPRNQPARHHEDVAQAVQRELRGLVHGTREGHEPLDAELARLGLQTAALGAVADHHVTKPGHRSRQRSQALEHEIDTLGAFEAGHRQQHQLPVQRELAGQLSGPPGVRHRIRRFDHSR